MLELVLPPSASLSARAAAIARRTANAKGSPRAVSSLNLAIKGVEGSTRGRQWGACGLSTCTLRTRQLISMPWKLAVVESSSSCLTLMSRMCQLIASATSPEAPGQIFSLPRHIQSREPPLPGILASRAGRRSSRVQTLQSDSKPCRDFLPLLSSGAASAPLRLRFAGCSSCSAPCSSSSWPLS